MIALILGVVWWSVLWTKQVVKELATRPDRQYQIAGVDRVSELQRASLIGSAPEGCTACVVAWQPLTWPDFRKDERPGSR